MILLNIFVIIILLYIGFGFYLYFYQRRYIYNPTSAMPNGRFPLIKIRNGFKLIRVVIANPGLSNAIIYFGGNDEQVNLTVPHFSKLFPRHTTYLVHYRGYGGSRGRPTEAAIYKDALAIYNNIHSKHRTISVIGRSLGSGVATYLAANRPIERLVLVTPFDSLERVAQTMYPFYPISWMLIDKFDSISRVPMIKALTLIILTEHDDVVPHHHSLRLAESFPPGQVSIQVLPNTTHSNLNFEGGYGHLLSAFLEPTSRFV